MVAWIFTGLEIEATTWLVCKACPLCAYTNPGWPRPPPFLEPVQGRGIHPKEDRQIRPHPHAMLWDIWTDSGTNWCPYRLVGKLLVWQTLLGWKSFICVWLRPTAHYSAASLRMDICGRKHSLQVQRAGLFTGRKRSICRWKRISQVYCTGRREKNI